MGTQMPQETSVPKTNVEYNYFPWDSDSASDKILAKGSTNLYFPIQEQVLI